MGNAKQIMFATRTPRALRSDVPAPFLLFSIPLFSLMQPNNKNSNSNNFPSVT